MSSEEPKPSKFVLGVSILLLALAVTAMGMANLSPQEDLESAPVEASSTEK